MLSNLIYPVINYKRVKTADKEKMFNNIYNVSVNDKHFEVWESFLDNLNERVVNIA